MKDKLNGCGPIGNGCCYPATTVDDVDQLDAQAANGFNGICNKPKLHGGKAAHKCDTTHRRHINNNEGHDHSLSPETSVDSETGAIDDVPTRTQVLKDPANICTFVGAIMAMLAFASMWNGRLVGVEVINVEVVN